MVDTRSDDVTTSPDFACSFPPICAPDARVLILGSMPGRTSLEAGQYYAHPQNAFWPIIESLFNVSGPLDYRERTRLLKLHRVALWDVLHSCERSGSLDSAIKSSSMVPNDFAAFYKAVPDIRAVFFNGATAEREYLRRVVPELGQDHAGLPTYRLPSTSPAMAGMTRKEKRIQWLLIKKTLGVGE